jgi:hypothetical protein
MAIIKKLKIQRSKFKIENKSLKLTENCEKAIFNFEL